MAKIILTDAKMNMLQSVWPEINALGEVKIAESKWAGTDLEGKTVGMVGFGRIAKKMAKRILNNETLVNVKNGDALVVLGEPERWFPYGELP
jgi:phosphoglycerate dehydrogenase-like enzyme